MEKKIKCSTAMGIIFLGGAFFISGAVYLLQKESDPAKKSFTYVADENGEISATGRVKYKEVEKNWCLLEKKFKNNQSKLFIVDYDFFDRALINVENGKVVASCSKDNGGDYVDETILNLESIPEYLITYDLVKESYGISDIEELLSKIEQDYEYSYEKKLVK